MVEILLSVELFIRWQFSMNNFECIYTRSENKPLVNISFFQIFKWDTLARVRDTHFP